MLQKFMIEINPLFLELDWSQILHDTQYFLLGFLTGIILLMLSLTFLFSRKERKKMKIRIKEDVALDDQVLADMIEGKINQLDKTVRLTDNGYFKVALDLGIELTEEISRYYFPESKYPLYELSIQELLDLSKYIIQRINNIMDGKVIRRFKNYRVASIMEALNARKKINNSKLMQVTRKLKLQQVYSASRAVLNYANPIYWFRKLAIKPTTVLVTKELCKTIITIFGEETNKVYSKTIFKEKEQPDEINKLIDEISESEEE